MATTTQAARKAAPKPACTTCGGTKRVEKPSAWFAGQTMMGYCPACTPVAGRAVTMMQRRNVANELSTKEHPRC